MHTPPFLAPGLACLFDLDGVIIDSMELHTLAWQEYVNRQGWSEDNLTERMLGKRNDQILRSFLGGALGDAEIFEHGAAKERLFREMMTPVFEQKLVPGVREFLSALNGTPCGLCTNAEPANADFVLDGAGIRARFRTIVDGSQVVNPKPAPDMYLEAARRLALDPRDCIIFEDSPGGLAAARAAGGRVICIESSLSNPPDVALSVRNFTDPRLTKWLGAQRPMTQ